MNIINIITPTTRFANIPIIYDSIVRSISNSTNIDFRWIVVIDSKDNIDTKNLSNTDYIYCPTYGDSVAGNKQRNFAIDLVDSGYVYFLDDDNIVHPLLFNKICGLLSKNAIVFNQVTKSGNLRLVADPSSMYVGGIDTAQCILPRDIISDTRWENYNYCADGAFFTTLYTNNKDKFSFIKENLSFYNYLR